MRPVPLERLQGTYFGSVAGTTVQRLVLGSDGSGTFFDVWEDSSGLHADKYIVRTLSRKGWNIELELTPASGVSNVVRARGTADFFDMKLDVGATSRYRKRSLRLYREPVVERLREFAEREQGK